MTVQQTSQLIQLILNSVLMANAAIVLLGILLLRQAMVHHRLRSLHHTHRDQHKHLVETKQDWLNTSLRKSLLQAGRQIKQLHHHYRSHTHSIVVVQAACITLITSTFFLTLRTIANANWLISLSLWLSVGGITLLLLGLGLALLELYRDGRLLAKDLTTTKDIASSQSRPITPPMVAIPFRQPRAKNGRGSASG